MITLDIIGVIANIITAFSVLPQIYTQIKTRARKGLSVLMLWLWILGNGLMVIYNLLGSYGLWNITFFAICFIMSVIMVCLYYFRSK